MLDNRIAAALSAVVPDDAPLIVAYSGGLDSTVLLHVLARLRETGRLRAVHVNHGLSPDAADWAEHCRQECEQLGIACAVLTVDVARAGGSLEEEARKVRYQALAQEVHAGEYVVTAHHQRDQLETVLLALMRGSGVHGMAAMPERLERNGMTLLRPMLQISHADLLAEAQKEGLRWVEDPTNADESFDRNYLRRRVVPLLEARWPAAAKAATRSARLVADAMHIIDEQAVVDTVGALHGNCLALGCLHDLSDERRRNVVRRVCRVLNLPVPSESQLAEALPALLSARADAEPLGAWPGTRVRRYRDGLWFYSEQADPGSAALPTAQLEWNPAESLDMGSPRGCLSLVSGHGQGIDAAQLAGPLQVSFRSGGEQLRPGPRASRRDLKKLLQERGVLPWMRGHIPLIYLHGDLLAVGDLWTNADHPAVAQSGGKAILWSAHPRLEVPAAGS